MTSHYEISNWNSSNFLINKVLRFLQTCLNFQLALFSSVFAKGFFPPRKSKTQKYFKINDQGRYLKKIKKILLTIFPFSSPYKQLRTTTSECIISPRYYRSTNIEITAMFPMKNWKQAFLEANVKFTNMYFWPKQIIKNNQLVYNYT